MTSHKAVSLSIPNQNGDGLFFVAFRGNSIRNFPVLGQGLSKRNQLSALCLLPCEDVSAQLDLAKGALTDRLAQDVVASATLGTTLTTYCLRMRRPAAWENISF